VQQLSQIVFTSDRSAVLPGPGATYQFNAQVLSGNAPTGAPVTWTSTNASIATVDASGKVTATGSAGSATVVASSPGMDSQAASVIIAQVAKGAVLVPSSDVIAGSQNSAVLKNGPNTSTIGVGTIVVSGDKGGLLGRVASVQVSGSQTSLTLTPAPLWQAFERLDIDVSSAPSTVQLSSVNGRLSISSHGRQLRTLQIGTFTCKNAAGASADVRLDGPTFTADVTSYIVANYHATWLGGIKDFRLSVVTTVPLKLTTGSLTFAANGHENLTCTAHVPRATLSGALAVPPFFFVGPTLDQTIVVSIDAKGEGTLTIAGPEVGAAATMTDGVAYNGGWQAIVENSQTGLQVTPAGTSFAASASVDVQSSYRADLGTTVLWNGLPITNANVAFGMVSGDYTVAITSPLGATSADYTGPSWSTNLRLQAGPELSLSDGLIGFLHDYFGVPTISQQWTVYDRTIPLSGSPTPSVAASPNLVKSGALSLSSITPRAYSGDRIEFVGFLNGSRTGTVLARATVGADGSARASWTPAASDNGSYRIIALLYDPIFSFASLAFPYASTNSASATVALASQPTPTPTPQPPGPTPTPTPTPQPPGPTPTPTPQPPGPTPTPPPPPHTPSPTPSPTPRPPTPTPTPTQVPVPNVTSISPTEMAVNKTQKLSIYGSFTDNNVVQFKWSASSGAGVWQNSKFKPSVTSGLITIDMDSGPVADSIHVRVCKSSSQTADADCSSGTQAVAVVVAPGKPTNTAPGSLAGPGPMLAGSTATLSWSASAGATMYEVAVRDVTTSENGPIVIDAFTSATSYSAGLLSGHKYRWDVQASNVAGVSGFTSPLYFQVAYPAPAISGVSPNPVPVSAAAQTVLVNGSNFIDKPTVTLTWTGMPNYTVPASEITYVSQNQVKMSIKVGTTPDTWTVKITNPDGQSSNMVKFTVK
jgi:hypothetical protein